MPDRPIRELINSKALRPTAAGGVMCNRRSGDRFTCKATGVLVASGRQFPIECLEISQRGVRISSQRPLALKAGEQVVVKVRMGSQDFTDTFLVVHMSRGSRGETRIHLQLDVPAPCLTAPS